MSEIERIASLLEQTFEGRACYGPSVLEALEGVTDAILNEKPIRVRGPFYLMLHGTLQHNVYHAGQISLLTGQMTVSEEGQ